MLNIEYIKNLNADSYFDIYSSEFEKLKKIQENHFPKNSLHKKNAIGFINQNLTADFYQKNQSDYQKIHTILNRHNILTTNYLIPSIGYEFQYNNQLKINDNNFYALNLNLNLSGRINSQKDIFEIPISEFLKIDFEFKKFWGTDQHTIGFRNFIGLAIPYGNTKEIPFTASYFIGGSNDLRAWKTYELGLGAKKEGIEFNIGNFKLLTNLEYRYKLTNSLQTALFIDAGNIWDITNSKLTSKEEKLHSFYDLKNIAVGSGFGFRYDFTFLILRMDLGFKTYEPYLEDNKWFQNYDFTHSIFNIGFNYPF